MAVWDSQTAAEFQDKLTREIPDAILRAKTGHGWDEWAAILAASRVLEKGFNATAQFLRHEYSLSTWWANILAARFKSS